MESDETAANSSQGGLLGQLQKFNLFEKPIPKPLQQGERREAICSTWSFIIGVAAFVIGYMIYLKVWPQYVPTQLENKGELVTEEYYNKTLAGKAALDCPCNEALSLDNIRGAVPNNTNALYPSWNCPSCPSGEKCGEYPSEWYCILRSRMDPLCALFVKASTIECDTAHLPSGCTPGNYSSLHCAVHFYLCYSCTYLFARGEYTATDTAAAMISSYTLPYYLLSRTEMTAILTHQLKITRTFFRQSLTAFSYSMRAMHHGPDRVRPLALSGCDCVASPGCSVKRNVTLNTRTLGVQHFQYNAYCSALDTVLMLDGTTHKPAIGLADFIFGLGLHNDKYEYLNQSNLASINQALHNGFVGGAPWDQDIINSYNYSVYYVKCFPTHCTYYDSFLTTFNAAKVAADNLATAKAALMVAIPVFWIAFHFLANQYEKRKASTSELIVTVPISLHVDTDASPQPLLAPVDLSEQLLKQ